MHDVERKLERLGEGQKEGRGSMRAYARGHLSMREDKLGLESFCWSLVGAAGLGRA